MPSYSVGGRSGTSTTRTFSVLPWANYRSVGTWLQEFVDTFGHDLDLWWDRFIGSRFATDGMQGRQELLDLDVTSSAIANESTATGTAPPTNAKSQDTVLDMLLYLAGIPWPVDSHWTTQQKREMVRVGWDALKYKGTRRRLLRLVAGPLAGVIHGANLPPFIFSLIHGDGSPSPGFSSEWCSVGVTQAGTVATTSGDATVTGTSTAFPTDGSWNGMIILIANEQYWISSVTNATELELTSNAVANTTGQTCKVVYAAAQRPWLFEATRNIVRRVFPSWATLGVGYSQFRAGFSAVGEPVLATDSRIGALLNEHFSGWDSATVPTSGTWTISGSGTINKVTENASPVPQVNEEFTSYAAQIDLSSATAGVGSYATQTAVVNNQIPHRLEVDYGYTNAQSVDVMTVRVSDASNDQTYYWPGTAALQVGTISIVEGSRKVTGTSTAFDTTGLWAGMPLTTRSGKKYLIESVESATSLTLRDEPLEDENAVTFSVQCWTTTATNIALPVGTAATTRMRCAIDVYPQRASQTAALRGTSSITLRIGAVSDGTATTTVKYTLYRAQLYPKHDHVTELEASGIRTTWLPLRDSLGWSALTVSASGALIENAEADRSSVKSFAGTLPLFEYHPAIGRRGYRNTATWTNIITTSIPTSGTWTASACTITNGATSLPTVGDTAGASVYTVSVAKTASTALVTGTSTASKSIIAGAWCKRISADPGNQAGTITITSGSATATGSGFSSSWVGSEIRTAAGYTYVVAAVGGATTLTLSELAIRTETAVQFAVADAVIFVTNAAVSAGLYHSFWLNQSEGWKLLPCPKTDFDATVSNMVVAVRFPADPVSAQFSLAHVYAYDVSGKTDVLYPPHVTTSGGTANVGARYLKATTDNVGTDVKDEMTKAVIASVSRGSMDLTVVPTYGATSQPNATLIDICESATVNRLHLHVVSGVLTLTRYNAAGSSAAISLTLTGKSDPSAGQLTWRRDEAIRIRARWDDDGNTSLSAGGGNASGATVAAPFTDTAVDTFNIGATAAGASYFDGIITDLEIAEVGGPVS